MFNLRDIGGHPAKGGTVRTGLIWRSNALVGLDDSQRSALAELKMATAIDLREPGERDAEPSDLGSLVPSVHELAVIDGNPEILTPDLLAFNVWMLAERDGHLVRVIKLLNSPGALPGVYFCSSGKDRTGLITALILSAMGVEDELVTTDYAETAKLMPESYHEHALQRALAGGMPEEQIAEYRIRGLEAPAPLMQETLDHLRAEYGGAEEYLLGAGLGAAELERLRSTLLSD